MRFASSSTFLSLITAALVQSVHGADIGGLAGSINNAAEAASLQVSDHTTPHEPLCWSAQTPKSRLEDASESSSGSLFFRVTDRGEGV